VNNEYWLNRIAEYREMIEHIKEQRSKAEPEHRRELAIELERLFNEINIIEEHLGRAA
jgi:hypothetical protein